MKSKKSLVLILVSFAISGSALSACSRHSAPAAGKPTEAAPAKDVKPLPAKTGDNSKSSSVVTNGPAVPLSSKIEIENSLAEFKGIYDKGMLDDLNLVAVNGALNVKMDFLPLTEKESGTQFAAAKYAESDLSMNFTDMMDRVYARHKLTMLDATPETLTKTTQDLARASVESVTKAARVYKAAIESATSGAVDNGIRDLEIARVSALLDGIEAAGLVSRIDDYLKSK